MRNSLVFILLWLLLGLSQWNQVSGQLCLNNIPGLTDSVCGADSVWLSLPEGADSARWDFCSGDLFRDFEVELASSLTSAVSVPRSISMVNDNGVWRGFLYNTSLSNLYRIDFGNGIDSAPTGLTQVTYSGSSAAISSSTWSRIEFINTSTGWHAFAATEGNVLGRIDFPAAGLSANTVSLTTYSNANGLGLNNARDVELIQKGDSIFLIIVSRISTELKIYSLGTNVASTPSLLSSISLPGFSSPNSIDVVYQCGEYFGLFSSVNDSKVGVIKFGSSLEAAESIQEVSITGSFPLPMKTHLRRENNQWIGFVKNRNNNIEFSRIFFGEQLTGSADSIIQTGAQNGLMLGWAFDLVEEGSVIYGIGVDISAGSPTYRMQFDDGCLNTSASMSWPDSTHVFGGQGTYYVELSYTDSTGQLSTRTDTVVVKPGVDLMVAFNEPCLGDSLHLVDISQSSAPITSWNWQVTAIGTGNSSSFDALPIFADTINVLIEVENQAGCSKALDTMVVVHPIPEIDVHLDSVCREAPLNVQNNSSIEFDSITSWKWFFNGQDSSQLFEPELNFSDSGVNQVSLIATSNFGCSSTQLLEVYVKDAPEAAFTVLNTCNGDSTSFINNAGSTIPYSAFWDLGDGATSNSESFKHLYNNQGDYDVKLLVTAENGCADSAYKEVSVSPQPTIDMLDLGYPRCTGQSIQAAVNVSGQPLTEVFWKQGAIVLDTQLQGDLFINDTGFVSITCIVNASTSCYDTAFKTVFINQSPHLGLEIPVRCEGDSLKLLDQSFISPLQDISNAWWAIDGDTIPALNVDYMPLDVGNHSIYHAIITDSGCFVDTTFQSYIASRPEAQLDLLEQTICTNLSYAYEQTSSIDINDVVSSQSLLVSYESGILDTIDSINGIIQYQYAGNIQVEYMISTNAGCQTTVVDQTFGFQSPELRLVDDTTCLNTIFELKSNYNGGNYSFNWSFGDQTSSNEPTPDHIYSSPGLFNANLQINDMATGCYDTQSFEILVLGFPELLFEQTLFCENSALSVQPFLSNSIDDLSSINWNFNGVPYPEVILPIFEPEQPGIYDLEYDFITDHGCSGTDHVAIQIRANPEITMDVSPAFGNVPIEIEISQTTFNPAALSIQGLIIAGDSFLTTERAFVLEQPQQLEIAAFAEDTLGCKTVLKKNYNFLNPKVDASITITDIRKINDTYSVSGTLTNTGSVMIDDVLVTLQAMPELAQRMHLNGALAPSASTIIEFSGLLLSNVPEMVCLQIDSVNHQIDDLISNNRSCLAGQNASLISSLFPNPTKDEINIVFASENCSSIDFRIYSGVGSLVFQEDVIVEEGGITHRTIDLFEFNKGSYLVVAICDGIMDQKVVIKN